MNSRLYSTVVLSKGHSDQNPENYSDNLDSQLRKIADRLYLKLSAQQITEDEMKIQFSSDVLTLVLSTISKVNNLGQNFDYSPSYFKKMDQLIGDNMGFLKTVYPKIKASKGKNNFAQHFKNWDESDKVQFDFLVNMGINFSSSKSQSNTKDTRQLQGQLQQPDRSYLLQQIQFLLNKIIISAQQSIPKFNNLLRSVLPSQLPRKIKQIYLQTIKDARKFQVDLLLGQNSNKLFNKQLIHQNLSIDSFGLFDILQKWIGNLEMMISQPEEFLAGRNYLKIANGSSRNVKKISEVKSMKIFGRKSNISRSSVSSSWDELNLFGELPQNMDKTENIKNNQYQREREQSFWEFIANGFRDFCKESNDLQGFDRMDEKSKNKFTDKRSAALWGESKAIKKKVEVISEEMQKIGENRKKYENFEFKLSGYPVASFSESIKSIGYSKNYEKFAIQQIETLQSRYSQNQKIVKKNNIRQKYTQNQKLIYSFAQNSYDFLQEMLLNKLVLLLAIILQYQQKLKNDSNSSKSVLQDIQLFSLRLRDIMSCSIVGDQDFITETYKALMDLHNSRAISIMKVQNRVNSAHKDILILFTMSGSPITCSLKLILQYKEAIIETKQVASEMLNDFFEEIESSSYGPLSYLSYILASMDHRVHYLSKMKKLDVAPKTPLSRLCHCGKGIISEQSSYFIFEAEIKNLINETGQIDLDVYKNMLSEGFVCGVCEKAVKKGANVLPVQKCNDCEYTICVDCAYHIYHEHQAKAYLTLLASVARIVDNDWQANLILQDARNMEYSHSYKKQGKKVNIAVIEKKVENYYDIIFQGRNIVKYEKSDIPQQFWKRVRSKIELKKLPCYQQAIKSQKYAGVILRPRELLRQKGTPFVFIHYDGKQKCFGKFTKKGRDLTTSIMTINQLELELEQNDIFFPIVWLQGEQMIPEYIGKVLRTNPFCKKTPIIKESKTFEKIKEITLTSNEQHFEREESDMRLSGSQVSISKSLKKKKITRPKFSSSKIVR